MNGPCSLKTALCKTAIGVGALALLGAPLPAVSEGAPAPAPIDAAGLTPPRNPAAAIAQETGAAQSRRPVPGLAEEALDHSRLDRSASHPRGPRPFPHIVRVHSLIQSANSWCSPKRMPCGSRQ
jgi:hypothetical protein